MSPSDAARRHHQTSHLPQHARHRTAIAWTRHMPLLRRSLP